MFATLSMLTLMINLADDPTKQFDFWVGNWNVEIETRPTPNTDNWTKSKGTNKIEKVLSNAVVQENFSGPGLVGKSWSVYDKNAKVWRQTWVDNTSGYIILTGKWEGDRMVLYNQPLTEGANKMRMVFRDIKPKSFEWEWEVLKKDGTWAPMFICHYKRK